MKTTYLMTALALTAVVAAPAFAEGAMKRSTTTTTEQPAATTGVGAEAIAPAAGAMTRENAKTAFEGKGYTNISNLSSDSNGTWRGTATVNGKKRNVMLDSQGTVTTQ